ncbi:chaoptin-like [Planococcus citri]|uniref:chaoptin-like n=1 Tax=Planococcus citri TaxID=170843 RepID=UPI0031FA00E5
MILTLIIFMKILFVGADDISHPSCNFNPLCTCSQAVSNLGIVSCINVPLPRIPIYMNRSKINSFHLENNGLKAIEPYFMSGTGLNMLKISQNPLYVIHDDTLKGLEISLRDLELSYLKLIQVPHNVLRSLQKLRTLNLSGNEISDIGSSNWVSVRNSLENLILRENAITFIPRNSFERFPELKTLDLSRNALRDMDPDAFFYLAANSKLVHINLADNQLSYIPYAQMQHLKSLKTLDLSYNFITSINAISESTRSGIQTKFSLNSLHLGYNNIKTLSEEDFQKFAVINRTFFDGNPISKIQIGAFQTTQIHELSFSGCGLIQFHPDMIKGLEKHLHVLDLSNNDLSSLDSNLYKNFLNLQEIRTKGNRIEDGTIPEYNGGLLGVEFGGGKRLNWQNLLRDLGRIKSLIRVSISNVDIPYLSYDSFIGYGLGVEEMSITNAELKIIHTQAFINVRGLKKLDLSNNLINNVHEHAFAEIGHSLLKLYLSNSFAKSMKTFPYEAMQPLNSLRVLDISFNNFEILPTNSFHAMPDLEVLRAHDCRFRALYPDTFLADVHVKLKEISLSFNYIDFLKTSTFIDLPELRYLNLEDNSINTIESKAFANLPELRWLYLKGNKISFIHPEAFENLPQLELLDLSFNNLKDFDFITLDQVGSLASLSLNLSFNDLNNLRTYSQENDEEEFSASVKILDVSSSKVFDISNTFFLPLESSLTHLYASKNYLTNVSEDVFGSLSQLQVLDLSDNIIQTVEHNAFHKITKLQILNLRNNRIRDIHPTLFASMKNLRIVDLSDNELKYLPELLFRDDSLEKVSISQNEFVKIPFKSFSPDAAGSLREFDVSHNIISSFHAPDLFSRFKSMISLDVSYNRLTRIDDYVFRPLTNLKYLDLSHNKFSQLMQNGRFFHGIEESLIYLGMNNNSLNATPDFPLPKLIHLHLSTNNISSFTPETVVNLTNLRVLDLSDNNLTSIPVLILSLRSLKSLNLSRNAIKVFTNNSLLSGFEELRELDISYLPLETFETGTLGRLISLITLHMNTYSGVDKFNIPRILLKNLALENLWLTVTVNRLNGEMKGQFPKKLRNFVFRGRNLQSVDSKILEGVTFPKISLKFEGTRLESLQSDIFWNMPMVRNISVDVRNNSLKIMPNPSTGTTLGSYNRTFLIDLNLSNNEWMCDCYIGWIELWKRMKRQLFCRYLDFSESKEYHACLRTKDDLRRTTCSNKPSLLIDVMKVELECGWSRSSYVFAIKIPYIILPLIWIYTNLF